MENTTGETFCGLGFRMAGTGLLVPVAPDPSPIADDRDPGVERYMHLTDARNRLAKLSNAIDRNIGYAVDADTSARGLVAASRRAERVARRLLASIESANRCH